MRLPRRRGDLSPFFPRPCRRDCPPATSSRPTCPRLQNRRIGCQRHHRALQARCGSISNRRSSEVFTSSLLCRSWIILLVRFSATTARLMARIPARRSGSQAAPQGQPYHPNVWGMVRLPDGVRGLKIFARRFDLRRRDRSVLRARLGRRLPDLCPGLKPDSDERRWDCGTLAGV